jgi:hypothetical protein
MNSDGDEKRLSSAPSHNAKRASEKSPRTVTTSSPIALLPIATELPPERRRHDLKVARPAVSGAWESA